MTSLLYAAHSSADEEDFMYTIQQDKSLSLLDQIYVENQP